ncbi:GGDEF domain-containing response regulator [Desulfurispira natronophila]|uniref:diguanylate cyclase n=1 Tax=Desulfurispira natronophila TaxID=682562 RepID=A0A7W7Y5Y5_9BACT|nr:diguanylate cyclase [Desulfurispira natronophila]MBB5022701.1 diguanylate cyclase (GGDEF)-like protein [Desulfurispira natronophila]
MEQKSRHKKPLILIADDSRATVHALVDHLCDSYRVQMAYTGTKALSMAKSIKPDLILLDIVMPEMDGYEVCHHLKEDNCTKNIPVIFITSRGSTDDEEKGLRIGAVDYISKPFQPAIVRARVHTHMTLKHKTDQLERLSMVDGLTQIPNRRFFDQQLEKLGKQAIRNRTPISLLMVDVDKFKPYNDNYGHGAGDEALRIVARTLADAISRPMDVVTRYGGEEFAVILPETDSQGAVKVAKNLRAAIETLNLPHEYSDTADHITVSLGARSVVPDTMESLKTLCRQCDEALYAAKERGRNRVVAYETLAKSMHI